MKTKLLLIITMLLSCTLKIMSQTIPTLFCGENAWMPDSVGTRKYSGKLKSNWDNIKQSNVMMFRYGGIAVDSFKTKTNQYIQIIDSLRAKGIEPILQVPYNAGNFDSSDASGIVKAINITNSKKIKYWIIANEPDKYSPSSYKTAKNICTYIKRYAIAMKRQDSTIKIIGPELSRIKPEDSSDPNQVIMDSLTGIGAGYANTSIIGKIGTGNGKASGKAYIDYLSWHVYPWDGTSTTQNRSTVIARITGTDSARMGMMKRKCDVINADATVARASYPLKPCITEANICYYTSSSTPSNDKADGVKANSMLAGQFWVEYMACGINRGLEWINFWSSIEGSPLGFMYNNTSSPVKKPTYYHMQQFAKYYSHDQSNSPTNYLGTTNYTNLKAYAVKTSGLIAVFVLNEDSNKTTNKIYTVQLGSTTPGSTYYAKMNIPSVSSSYTDTIYGQSTTMLLYNCTGSIAAKYRYELKDTANPWKNVWAASSPAVAVSAHCGPDFFTCCPATISTANISGASYNWYKSSDNYTTSQGTSNSLFASTNFTWKVVVTAGGCTATDYITLTGTSPSCCKMAGIDPLTFTSQSELISSIPNPNNGKTTIYFSLVESTHSAEILIMDVFGKIIRKIPVPVASESIDVDLTDLPAGMYLYSLSADNKIVGSKKMMISK